MPRLFSELVSVAAAAVVMGVGVAVCGVAVAEAVQAALVVSLLGLSTVAARAAGRVMAGDDVAEAAMVGRLEWLEMQIRRLEEAAEAAEEAAEAAAAVLRRRAVRLGGG
jgi:ABC-type branched-subunit amino acid transport system substrate-binding protein